MHVDPYTQVRRLRLARQAQQITLILAGLLANVPIIIAAHSILNYFGMFN